MAPPKLQYPFKDQNFLKVPESSPRMYVLTSSVAYIPLPYQETYRRVRTNFQGQKYEHIFNFCITNTTKKDCGKWINVAYNKTVPSGATEYNTYFGSLMIGDIRKHDAGIYMTENRNQSIEVIVIKGIL